MSLGDNIKKIRKEKKLTQKKLAEEMGISRSYLSDVENNRYDPSSKTIESFAEKLGVSMYYLITGEKLISDFLNEEQLDLKEQSEQLLEQVDFSGMVKNRLLNVFDKPLEKYEILYFNAVFNYLQRSSVEDVEELSNIIHSLAVADEFNLNEIEGEKLSTFIQTLVKRFERLVHSKIQ